MRLGWFRRVHRKSASAQEVRALLTARKLLQGKLHDVEMSIRGVLRGFGLKVGATTSRTYAKRVQELVEGHAVLQAIAASLLKAREVLAEEFRSLDRRLRGIARDDDRTRRLMTTPGVGALVALTFVAAVDDPSVSAPPGPSVRTLASHPGSISPVRPTTPAASPRSATPVSGRCSTRRPTLS
jgi:transposase